MTILQDDFLNKKFLNRLKKELEEESLEKTINEIDYLNKIQEHALHKAGFSKSENEQLDFIKKLNNARRKFKIQA